MDIRMIPRKVLDRFRSSESTKRRVVLYTRVGCHLCEDARQLLEKYERTARLQIEEVDIDRDPELRAKFDCCVPVVEVDGVVRFRGRVNEVLLRRLLRARPST